LISVIESYLSIRKINQEERQKLGELFNSLDTDNNGTIDASELIHIYKENCGPEQEE
jgi:Ca2+-binding EF-hand superfamily protein